MTEQRYTAMRLCSTCRRNYEYPLDDGWEAVGGLWRCPSCAEHNHYREALEKITWAVGWDGDYARDIAQAALDGKELP